MEAMNRRSGQSAYVQVFDNDVIGTELLLTEEEASNLNLKLDAEGETYRWVPWGQRKDDECVAVAA